MRRLMLAGFLVLLAGCASRKTAPTRAQPAGAHPEKPVESSSPSQAPPSEPSPSQPVAPSSPDSGSSAANVEHAVGAPSSSKPSSNPAKSTSPESHRNNPGATAVGPSPPPISATTQKGAPPTLDLADLEQRLRDTHVIGVFTKLSLKNQVDDLLNEFRALYREPNKRPPPELRQRYDLLLLKLLSLLQDSDPSLALAISSSREAIWGILADPDKFKNLRGS